MFTFCANSAGSPLESSEPVSYGNGWNSTQPRFGRAHLMMSFITTLGAEPPASPNDPYPNVPQELKDLPRWVVWRYEKRGDDSTKVPYDPNTSGRCAKSNSPSTWSSFEKAISVSKSFNGVGFMLKGSAYIGIDFDGVIENGKVELYVQEILRLLGNPYSEVTPSGKGIRAFVSGILPTGKRKFGRSAPKKYGVEI